VEREQRTAQKTKHSFDDTQNMMSEDGFMKICLTYPSPLEREQHTKPDEVIFVSRFVSSLFGLILSFGLLLHAEKEDETL
jgi:hypothetical protein